MVELKCKNCGYWRNETAPVCPKCGVVHPGLDCASVNSASKNEPLTCPKCGAEHQKCSGCGTLFAKDYEIACSQCHALLRYNHLKLVDVLRVLGTAQAGSPEVINACLDLTRMLRFGTLKGKRETVIQSLALLAEAGIKSGSRDVQVNVASAYEVCRKSKGIPVFIIVVFLLVIIALGIVLWRWLF
jgi:hypothetical protein